MSGFCQETPRPPPATPEHRWLGLFSPRSQRGSLWITPSSRPVTLGSNVRFAGEREGGEAGTGVTGPHAGLPEREGAGTEAQGSPSPRGHLSAGSRQHGHQQAKASCGFLVLPYRASLDKNQFEANLSHGPLGKGSEGKGWPVCPVSH